MEDQSPGAIAKVVVARGAATCLLVAMPAALINVSLSDQHPKPQAGINASFVVVLVAFVLGGLVAGLEAPSAAAKHGALAAVAAFVPIELVAILGRLDRGAPIRIGSIIVVGLLAACAGTVGAQLGAKRRARRNPT